MSLDETKFCSKWGWWTYFPDILELYVHSCTIMNKSMYVPYCECILLMARADVPHEVVLRNVAMTSVSICY